MRLLKNINCILFYSVDPKYFERFSKVHCESDGQWYWRTAEENTCILTYDIHFLAKNIRMSELFIQYKGRMTCTLAIKDRMDVMQILTLIKDFHSSMNGFIKNNCLSYQSKLNLYDYEVTERSIIDMEASIAKMKEMKPHEDKSESDKTFEKTIEDIQFKVEIIKTKNPITH